MILYFADRFCHVLYTASTDAVDGKLILSDTMKDDLTTGVKTLEVKLTRTEESQQVVIPGNLVFQRTSYGENELFTIIESTYDAKSNTISIYCEDAGLDLLNTTVGAWEATASKSLAECIATISGSAPGWTILNNSSSTTKMGKEYFSYSGDESFTSRMLSFMTIFGTEMYFSYEIDGLNVIKRYINIVKKRGDAAATHTYTFGVELSNIVQKGTIEDVATAFTLYGVNKKGNRTALSGLSGYSTYSGKTYKPTDTTFPTKRTRSYKVTGNQVQCVEGMTQWGSSLRQWGVITRVKETSYNNAKNAIEYAIREIEKVVDTAYSYEVEFVDIHNEIKTGDYIQIVDEGSKLYLKSRVQGWSKSETGNSFEVTLSNVSKLTSSKAESVDISSIDSWSISVNRSIITEEIGLTRCYLNAMLYLNGTVITDMSMLGANYALRWYDASGNVISAFENQMRVEVDLTLNAKYTCKLEDLTSDIPEETEEAI